MDAALRDKNRGDDDIRLPMISSREALFFNRTGGGVRPGFEGGQTPLAMRYPKPPRLTRGHKRTVYRLINLDMLNQVEENATVDSAFLKQRRLLTRRNKKLKWFKVLGNGNLTTKGLIVRAHSFSKSAKAAIEGLGGRCVKLSMTRHMSREDIIQQALSYNTTAPPLDVILTKMQPHNRRIVVDGKLQLVNSTTKLTRKQLRFVRKSKMRTKLNSDISKAVIENNTQLLNHIFVKLK